MFERIQSILLKSRRALTVALCVSILSALAAGLALGPGHLPARSQRSIVWAVLAVLCFGGGYLVFYVQVRNPFAPKRFVAQCCVVGICVFAIATLLGWGWVVRSLATDEAAPFAIVGPAALGL
jgi:CHASE2 domain-containing sensor protein